MRFTKSGEGIEKTGINIHQGGIKPSMTDVLTRSPGGETGRCCVERERLGSAPEPVGTQGFWSALWPPFVHHSSHGSQVQGTSVALQTNSPR